MGRSLRPRQQRRLSDSRWRINASFSGWLTNFGYRFVSVRRAGIIDLEVYGVVHFGLICPTTTGHLNTMIPVGKELVLRGHQVTLIARLEAEQRARSAGLEFQAYGEFEFPLGSVTKTLAALGERRGRNALKFTIEKFAENASIFLRDAPPLMNKLDVQALLVDQATVEGGTVADLLQIPFVSICSAVVLNRHYSVPPPFTNWPYSNSTWAHIRNQIGGCIATSLLRPVTDLIDRHRSQWKLELPSDLNDRFSRIAQISQQPAELEFPRKDLPAWFNFTGPFHSAEGRQGVDFPYERLTGQPLIYACLGTILGNQLEIFSTIARACLQLDTQLVISLGGAASNGQAPRFEGSPIVVPFAPQLELIKRAALCITHGGLNTALECLANGVPMVALPMVNDQPGVAARVAWAGCGVSIPIRKVTVAKLRRAIDEVLTQDTFRQNATRLKTAIQKAGGVQRACDIIEKSVVNTGDCSARAVGLPRG